MMLKHLLHQLAYRHDVLCPVCEGPTDSAVLCTDCRQRLSADRLTGTLCPVCGQPLEPAAPCPMCARTRLMEARSVWLHQGIARKLVHILKYENRRDAAIPLGSAMAEAAQPLLAHTHATVTWVTMPTSRYRTRQYDHAQLLAQQAAKQLDLPIAQLLTRNEQEHAIAHQVGATAEQRLANLRGTFTAASDLRGTILLIDDVLTTGATAATAAACLREAGADRVLVITATRAAAGAPITTKGGITHV